LELADAVIDACNEPNNFKFLYELSTPLRQRIEMIAREVYGADGVEFSSDALVKQSAWKKTRKLQSSASVWSRRT